MEIGSVRQRGNTSFKNEDNKINLKKDFSQSFGEAKDRKSNEELQQLIKNINSKGNRLIISKSYADVRAYKRHIKEYLESVLKYMFKVKNDTGFWQSQYFITVETIDKKLEELTESLLKEEKENIKIATMVDEIQGLIVDIYR